MSESSPQDRNQATGKTTTPERDRATGELSPQKGSLAADELRPRGEEVVRPIPQVESQTAGNPLPQGADQAVGNPLPQEEDQVGVGASPQGENGAAGKATPQDEGKTVARPSPQGENGTAASPGTEHERTKRGERVLGTIRLCRRLARALLVALVLAFMNNWQVYSYAHEGRYPFGASIGEVTLIYIVALVLGNALITYVSARAEHGTRVRHGMPRPDSETSTYEELKGLIPFSKFTGPMLGVIAIWFFASMSACDRLDATREHTGLLLVLVPLSFLVLVILEFGAAWIGEATQRAYGWNEESKSRYQALEKEARKTWEREHPEEAARMLAEEARKLEEAERKMREEAERKAQAERFYAASAGVRRRAAMQASREAATERAIKRAHKKNPALCPKCGSADVVVINSGFKPSLIGAAIGSSEGFLGAVTGAALLGRHRSELMCRRCGARWKLR